jgi:hypothetical protein
MTLFHKSASPLLKHFVIVLALLLLLQFYLIYRSWLNDISNISCWMYHHIRDIRDRQKDGDSIFLGLSAFFSYLCSCLFACRCKSFFSAFFSHLMYVYIPCYILICIYSIINYNLLVWLVVI